MQINGVAAWGQRDLAPEVERKQSAGSVAQQDPEEKVLRGAESGRTKKQGTDSYEQSEEADNEMLKYLELLNKERSSADKQRQVQSDELKAMRIAHNIMRGKKVPPKDESFLLTKNFKMYMAAKNVASMKRESTGTAKSELGSDSASATSGTSSGGSSSGSAGASEGVEAALTAAGGMAVGGEGEMAEGLVEDITDLAMAEGLQGSGANAMASDGLFAEAGVLNGTGKTTGDALSSGAQGTDYSTLLDSMKASSSTVRSSGVSQSSAARKKKHKRFQYNFKEISARIMSVKTSGNAKQVLVQARQKSASLRKKLKSGEYDEESVQMALIHAEAMERVAKKKMKHLQEEESASRSGGVCAGDTDDEDRMEQQLQDEQMLYEMQSEADPNDYMAGMTGTTATNTELPLEDVSIEELMAEAMQTPVFDITGDMAELMEDFSELMEDTLEDVSGLEELAEDMLSGGGKTIDPADLEEKKRKHRTEEQRAIAEADSKYLKAFFDKLQREQQAIASGASEIAAAMSDGGGMISLASASAPAPAPAVAASPAPETTGTAGTAAVQTEPAASAPSGTTAAPAADISVSVDIAAAPAVSVDVSI